MANEGEKPTANDPGFPSRLMFKVSVDCPRVRVAPRIDGDLVDWADIPPLPDLSTVDRGPGFAEVKIAYNQAGLYVALAVAKKDPVAVNRSRPYAADSLQLFIDTRATQTVHRGTRFCHWFILLPRGGGPSRREATAWQERLQNAMDHPPQCRPEQIVVASHIDAQGYTLAAALPAEILNGYEPEPGHEIGFTYLVTDNAYGQQLWASPPNFPFERDPSLWGLLRL